MKVELHVKSVIIANTEIAYQDLFLRSEQKKNL